MNERGMTMGDRFIVTMMVIGAMAATAHLDWTRGQQIKAVENRVAAIESQTTATAHRLDEFRAADEGMGRVLSPPTPFDQKRDEKCVP